MVRAAAPLVAERVATLREAASMLGFLLAEEGFTVDPDAAAKQLGEGQQPVVAAAVDALDRLADWVTDAIEQALRVALVDGLGLKPRLAFGPVRVAVTGSTVSPPLFESIELLGRDRTLTRLRAALR
jgi:glutamyl-tRNA synthetase